MRICILLRAILLDEPEGIPILAPVVKREIYYRLLVGDQGAGLRQMALTGSQRQQIASAIDWKSMGSLSTSAD
jgi:hypothetical protein